MTWATAGLCAWVLSSTPPLHLPEPAAPEVQVIEERGPSPIYYRTPNDLVRYAYRVGLGGAISLASGRDRVARGRFSLDVLSGLELGLRRGARVAMLLEAGYSYAVRRDHFFVLGLGPIVRDFGPPLLDLSQRGRGNMTAGVVPHLVAGALVGDPAAGLRTSAFFHVLMIGVEVAHQYVVTSSASEHDLRVMFTLGKVGAW